MKLTLNLLVLAMFTILFASCSDSVVTPSADVYQSFNYSVQNIDLEPINSLSAGDDKTIFISASGKGYRMDNGIPTQIDLQDPNFTAYGVKAVDKDYAIFEGISAGFVRSYKIYDMGNIRSISAPFNINGGIFVIEKNKFITGGTSANKYRLYINNTFTEHTLPDSAQPSWTGFVGNHIYMFAINRRTFNSYYVYRITDDGPFKIREESAEGVIRVMNDKVFIKTVEDINSHTHTFYNYTEQGWQYMYSYETTDPVSYVHNVAGPSKDFFLEMSIAENNSSGYYYIPRVWNGTALYTQSNFPENDFPASTSVQTFQSEYINNTFYLYRNNGSSGGKLLKVTLKAK